MLEAPLVSNPKADLENIRHRVIFYDFLLHLLCWTMQLYFHHFSRQPAISLASEYIASKNQCAEVLNNSKIYMVFQVFFDSKVSGSPEVGAGTTSYDSSKEVSGNMLNL